MHQRGEESERLLEWAFREFEDVTLFTAGDTVEQAPVWLGAAPTRAAGRRARPSGDDAAQLAQQGQGHASVYDSPIRAPVVRGTALGKLVGHRVRACRT